MQYQSRIIKRDGLGRLFADRVGRAIFHMRISIRFYLEELFQHRWGLFEIIRMA